MKSISHAGSLTGICILRVRELGRPGSGPTKGGCGRPSGSSERSLSLAEHGKCKEALRLLRKISSTGGKELKRKAGVNRYITVVGRARAVELGKGWEIR
jgi:hypothetical protein